MRNTHLAAVLLTISALIGQMPLANAHDANGSLGSASSAVDYYQVQCSDDGSGPTGRLEVAIKDLIPVAAPRVSIQVSRDKAAMNTTDATDGDAAYSPTISFKGNDGFFYLTVDKTAAGVENYSISFHCLTIDGQHTGTDIFQLTNQ